MPKDRIVWLCVGLLFVEGVIWARLMGPFPTLIEINMATVAAWVAAGGAVATAVIAYKAAASWREQLPAQHRLDVARRIAHQMAICERIAPTAYSVAIFWVAESKKPNIATGLWAEVMSDVRTKVDRWIAEVAKLEGLKTEYRAVWGDPPHYVFDPIIDLVWWSCDCFRSFDKALSPQAASLLGSISMSAFADHAEKKACSLGIPTEMPEHFHEYINGIFEPAKGHISERMKL